MRRWRIGGVAGHGFTVMALLTAAALAMPSPARAGDAAQISALTAAQYYGDYNQGPTIEVGTASWYGGGKVQGRRTASGERFDQQALTAAHPTLPFATRVLVTNLENGRSVIVRITDRNAAYTGRVIDLSRKAAELIGLRHQGIGTVAVVPLDDEPPLLTRR